MRLSGQWQEVETDKAPRHQGMKISRCDRTTVGYLLQYFNKRTNKDRKKKKCSLCLLNDNWTLNVTLRAKECRRCELFFGLWNKIRILRYNNTSATSPQCNIYCDAYLKRRNKCSSLNNNWILIVTIYAKHHRWVFHPRRCLHIVSCLVCHRGNQSASTRQI